MNQPIILILPGWQDSGPEHWQSFWLKKYPNAIKVEQTDWMYAKKEEWVKTLNDYIEKYKSSSIILVGHSLACATIVHWSKDYCSTSNKIGGALLVSASDVEKPDFPKEITGFSPMPIEKLKFKSIVVASEDDPYVSMERAKYFAECWGSEFINIGLCGHINSDSKLGEWKEGQKLLKTLTN